MSAALRRKSCSCWLVSELIPFSITLSSGSTIPRTRALLPCLLKNISTMSSTWQQRTKLLQSASERQNLHFIPKSLVTNQFKEALYN